MPLTVVYTESNDRVYRWPARNGGTVDLIPVTTITGTTPKPHLFKWYGTMAAKAAVHEDEWVELTEEDAIDYLASRAVEHRDKRGNIGSFIHQRIAGHYVDEKDRPDPFHAGYVSYWPDFLAQAVDFIEHHSLTPTQIEVELASPRAGYAGTCDMAARDADGRLWIIDWKTSNYVSTDHTMQIVALGRCTNRLSMIGGKLLSIPCPPDMEDARKVVVYLKEESWKCYKAKPDMEPVTFQRFTNLLDNIYLERKHKLSRLSVSMPMLSKGKADFHADE